MQTERTTAEVARPERRGASRRSVIDEAKSKVRSIDLADRLCGPGQLRKIGRQWAALCPLPDHQERTASFTVYADNDRGWFCFGCLKGGDVIELARHAWGYEKSEVATAAAMLLMEFGHEVPPRPTSWHAKQSRQERARRAIEESKVRRVQRRLYRWILAPALMNITDEAERLEEAEHAWEDAAAVARILVLKAHEEAA